MNGELGLHHIQLQNVQPMKNILWGKMWGERISIS